MIEIGKRDNAATKHVPIEIAGRDFMEIGYPLSRTHKSDDSAVPKCFCRLAGPTRYV